MSRPNKARRRTPFDSVESLVDAVRDVCRREYRRDHGFPWPWEQMPEQEWTLVTPDKTVEGPEIRKKIQECAEQFLSSAAFAYDIARQSNSSSAAALKRLADAVLRSPADDLMQGGKVAVGREFIVSTARGNEWATGVSTSPRQLAIVSLLYGNWPSQITPKYTVAEVIAQEAKAIRLWLQRSKPMPRDRFTYISRCCRRSAHAGRLEHLRDPGD